MGINIYIGIIRYNLYPMIPVGITPPPIPVSYIYTTSYRNYIHDLALEPKSCDHFSLPDNMGVKSKFALSTKTRFRYSFLFNVKTPATFRKNQLNSLLQLNHGKKFYKGETGGKDWCL